MKILVLVKQVPMARAMALDPETRTLKREGVRLEVSSFDVRALLEAIELRDEGEAGRDGAGGEVVALTMGPPQARAALEYCLALGADRGVQLSDPAFAGADTLATARALALAIEREGYDLVLCGRHSTDAETGQVGPEVAELLGLPQVTGARALTVDRKAYTLTAERETDAGFETVECPLPALVSATEDLAPERFAKKADREQAKSGPIDVWSAADLSADLDLIGAAGSATWVSAIETVTVERRQQILEGELPDQIGALVEILLEHGLYGTWADAGDAGSAPVRQRTPVGGKAVWVVAEVLGGELRPVTFELLGKAAELAGGYHGEVAAVLPGSGLNRHVAALAAYGADAVYLADDPRLADHGTGVTTTLLARAIERHRPGVVLFGATNLGRDLAPRVAARLELGLTGDCIDLEVSEGGRLVQYKPAFGGNVVAPILSRTSPKMATVRPGMLRPPVPAPGRKTRIERLDTSDLPASRVRVVARSGAEGLAAAALDHAEIVVGVGRGIGGPKSLVEIGELAEVLGGAPLATTRTVADLGWLPRQHQVGLTGKAISPQLYVAVGLRGAIEHTVGIRNAGLIVAINDRRRSPIFEHADAGIVGDWAEVLPRLTAALAAARTARSAQRG